MQEDLGIEICGMLFGFIGIALEGVEFDIGRLCKLT